MTNRNMRISAPISKIDMERRLVHGFATLDNVDEVSDIIPIDVAEKAFDDFRGNLREMHQPVAVGRVLNFERQPFFAEQDASVYNGIYVTAYVSRGAQDTWEKVCDGTLTGFSIGAMVHDAETAWDNDKGQVVQVIKDMSLFELSLVDNPANKYANILTVEKSGDGVTVKGIAVGVSVDSVLYCQSCRKAFIDQATEGDCSMCGSSMTSIGWVEHSSEYPATEVAKMISDHNSEQDRMTKNSSRDGEDDGASNDVPNYTEGGIHMEDKAGDAVAADAGAVDEAAVAGAVDAEIVDVVAEVPSDAADEPGDVVDEAVAESGETVDEKVAEFRAELDSESFLKAIEDLRQALLEHVTTVTADAVAKANAGLVDAIDTKFAALGTEVKTTLDSVKEYMSVAEKRLDGVESATAIKKSAESTGSPGAVRSNIWGGRFLDTTQVAGER